MNTAANYDFLQAVLFARRAGAPGNAWRLARGMSWKYVAEFE
jgi:hypothetical protein